MEITLGKTYAKGERKRMVIGFESYFVIYRTLSSRPRIVGEARWKFEKWLKGATLVQ